MLHSFLRKNQDQKDLVFLKRKLFSNLLRVHRSDFSQLFDHITLNEVDSGLVSSIHLSSKATPHFRYEIVLIKNENGLYIHTNKSHRDKHGFYLDKQWEEHFPLKTNLPTFFAKKRIQKSFQEVKEHYKNPNQ